MLREGGDGVLWRAAALPPQGACRCPVLRASSACHGSKTSVSRALREELVAARRGSGGASCCVGGTMSRANVSARWRC